MLKNNDDLFIKKTSVCSVFLCVIVGRELHCIVQRWPCVVLPSASLSSQHAP